MASKVILGDALEGMKRLDKEIFDCVYADPDYNVGVNYNGKRYKRPFEEYIEWCSEWSREAHRLLKPTGNFLNPGFRKKKGLQVFLIIIC